MTGRRLFFVLAGLVLVLATGGERAEATESRLDCGFWQSCVEAANPGCHDDPSSLLPWMPPPTPGHEIVDRPDSGNCGWEECWLIFVCACGPGLASYMCPL